MPEVQRHGPAPGLAARPLDQRAVPWHGHSVPPDNRDDDLRRQIRELAARVETLVSEAREHETRAAALRAEADRLMPGAGGLGRTAGLPKVRFEGTLGTMEALQANAGSKVSQAKTKHPWPFSAALHAHGSSPAQWAEAKKGRPPAETVRAWLKRPGKGGRPIPRRWADDIEAEFAETETPVPARDASWPNKIR